jgi:acyl-CoA reductase-like NAD-dependent aldehyde dehydrogenase
VLPMEAVPEGEGRLGFTLPEPCGVVVAITPWNYPALLVMHKIGPALAAGNAVILKPASATPLTALSIVSDLVDAGVPADALQCITGSGGEIGTTLCKDPRVRKISFTGSRAVGEQIAKVAGLKRLTCELGSNTAMVVLDDADLDAAAAAAVLSGYTNAGQICIAAQRLLVSAAVRDEFVDRVRNGISQLRMGDPREATTRLGPLISVRDAERVRSWLDEARDVSETVIGGGREGAFVHPAIVLEPPTDSRVWSEELFGPAIAVRRCKSDDEAIAATNASRYGLAASVFTRDIDRALRFAREIRTGVVHVNNGPAWRTDFMPYGGYGDSGYGKEGVRYAMDEMSERKLVVVHPRP